MMKNQHRNTKEIIVITDAKTKEVGEDDPALTYQMTLGTLVNDNTFSRE